MSSIRGTKGGINRKGGYEQSICKSNKCNRSTRLAYQVGKCWQFTFGGISEELRTVNHLFGSVDLIPVVVHGIRLKTPVIVLPVDVLLAENFENVGVVETLNLVGVGEEAVIIATVTKTSTRNKESAVWLGGDRTGTVPFINQSIVLSQSVLDRNVIDRETVDSFTGNIFITTVSHVLTSNETVHLGSLHFFRSRSKSTVDGEHVISGFVLRVVNLDVHGNRLRANLGGVRVRDVETVAKLTVSNSLDFRRVVELTDHVVK